MTYREPEFLPWDGRRVPITFVGGYLGAGKTTAINEVLVVADRPVAVIVNDAGAVNVDASIVKGFDGDLIELTDLCVCCTSIDDMGHALDAIRARPEPPDHLVIELSGIAEPKNILPWGRSVGFMLDGVVIVVAADQLLDDELPPWIRVHLEAQIAAADLVVLTKLDVLDHDAQRSARQRLEAMAPATPVVDGSFGRREPGMLGRFLSLGGHYERDVVGVPGPTLFDLHQTHTVDVDGPLTCDALHELIAELPERFPGRTVARAKAVVDLIDGRHPQVLVQIVGSRTAITPLLESERRQPTNLVVITVGQRLDDQETPT